MENNLPEGWALINLGGLCLTASGGTPDRKSPGYYNGNIPWVKSGELDNGLILDTEEKITEEALIKSSAKVFPKGTLLIALYGATIGRLSFLGIDAATNQAVCGIFKNDNYDLKYLYYFLFYSKPYLIGQGIGGAQPNISQTILKNLEIPLPPLPEQHRIVAKLDVLMERVERNKQRLDKVPALLKRFRQSVLAAAVSGRLTEGWRRENGSEGEWGDFVIGDLTESSFYGPRFSKEDYSSDGIPTLRTTDFNSYGKIELRDPPKIKITAREIEKFKIMKDDILITRTGSIGTVAIFKDTYLAIPSAYLIRFRLNDIAVADFIFLFLLSPYGQELLGANATAVTQPNVNAEKIKLFPIRLPRKNEQHEIVRRVEQLFGFADKIEARYIKVKAMLDRLPQSILAKAFRGELVPQDPEDEPAGALLERIKGGKKERGTKKRDRSR